MNTDHDFQIGNQHTICQDYATSGILDNGIAYAIVSDGCSKSPYVDIGARILAMAARDTLNYRDKSFDYEQFAQQTIFRVNEVNHVLPINPRALDATLLVAFVEKDLLKVYLYGDGAMFHKSGDNVNIIHVSFGHNAPDYLSYFLDDNRMEEYKNSSLPTSKTIETNLCISDCPVFSPVEFETVVKPGDIIGVCSDGINSFQNNEGESLFWENILFDFFKYKSTNGVFVNRRLAAFKRQCQKDGWTHYDDISCAAIVV